MMQRDIPDPDELPLIRQDELNEIIQKHARYLQGQKEGARAVFQYCNLSDLDFQSQDLSQADFTGCALVDCNFFNATLTSANFFACDLRNTNFAEADLSRCDLRGAYMAGVNFSAANMHDADLREGKIMKRGEHGVLTDRKRSAGEGSKAILVGAKLTGANMEKVQARSADFTDADLSGVVFTDAELEDANFEGANLADCDMSRADLTHVNMKGAIIAGMVHNFAEIQGLDTTGAVSERDMGRNLANLGKTLPELLEEHTLWVSSVGKRGRQLDLSGYDMREVVELKTYPLTAIKAIEGNFLNQNLSGAELQSGVFDRSDFRDCEMQGADLRGSSFKYAQFSRANLSGAQLCPLQFGNKLQRVDLSGSNFRYADLTNCDLRDCIMMGVDLTGVTLSGADLRRTDLTGAIFDQDSLDTAQTDGAVF